MLVWRGWGYPANNIFVQRGFIQFLIDGAADNETPADQLGYRFEYVDGTMPEGLTIFPTAFSRPPTGELYLAWDDGATWDQDEFLFRVAVRSIDQAGNKSGRSNVVIAGHDGDMERIRRIADGAYMRTSYERAERAAKVHLHADAAMTVDTVRVESQRTTLQPPERIEDVYESETIGGIRSLHRERVDRVALKWPRDPADTPYELDPYSLTESGRELTADEVFQLQSLLLDVSSYAAGELACGFTAEYAFASIREVTKIFVVVGTHCHQVSISGPGFQAGGNLTPEAAGLLQALCEGLFRFAPIE